MTVCFRNGVLRETGLAQRELRIWFGTKPKCVSGKTVTDKLLVSVGIKDVSSLLVLLSIGFVVSLTLLLIEIIIHRYHAEKTKPTNMVINHISRQRINSH